MSEKSAISHPLGAGELPRSGTDFERQAALMVALDVWLARTCGPWIENGWCAVRTDRPFEAGRTLAFGRSCTEWPPHRLDPSRACTFVDEYAPSTRRADRVDRVRDRLDRERAQILTLGPEIPLPRPLADAIGGGGRVLTLADGRVVAVQARLFDGAQEIARPDTWAAMPLRPWRRRHLLGPWSAAVVGQRGGEDVALVMTVVGPGWVHAFPPPAVRSARSSRGATP